MNFRELLSQKVELSRDQLEQLTRHYDLLQRWNPIINLTRIENLVLGTNFSEFHTGYRAYTRKALEGVNFEANSENFLFDNEIIVQLVLKGFRFKEIPVTTRYSFDCSSVGFRQGCVYGLGILKTIAKYIVHRLGIYRFKQFL